MTTQKDIRSLQLRLAGIAEELRELEEVVEAGEPGPEGPAGPQGPAGPTGDDGEGVPAGGTTGQVLAKIDGADYNTEWATPSGGGAVLGDLALLDTVGSSEIDDSAVTAAKIGPSQVTSDKIATDAVTTEKIADGAINTARLADAAVTSSKIGIQQVSNANIAINAISTSRLDNESVTAAKIKPANVQATQLGSNAVTTDKILNYAVTANKIGASAVSNWQLDTNYEKTILYKDRTHEAFMPWSGEVLGTFDNRRLMDPLVLDRFLGRSSEIKVLLDGVEVADSQKKNFTNQSYAAALDIAAAGGNTGVLTLDLETYGLVSSNGFTYAQGYVTVTFYAGRGPVSMTARSKDRNGVWTNRTCRAEMTSNGVVGATEAVYWSINLNGNYVTEIEITATSNSTQPAAVGNISYLGTRMVLSQGPIINTLGGTFFGTVAGKEAGVENWSITQSGAAEFDSVTVEGRPVLPANQFYDSAGGYVYTVYGVNSNWQATRADSSGMLSSAIQTSNLPTVLSGVSGLTYS